MLKQFFHLLVVRFDGFTVSQPLFDFLMPKSVFFAINYMVSSNNNNNNNNNYNNTHKLLWDFDIQTDHLI